MTKEKIAQELLLMAARRSTETQFGWAHPDCEILQKAAWMLNGELEPKVIDPNEPSLETVTIGDGKAIGWTDTPYPSPWAKDKDK